MGLLNFIGRLHADDDRRLRFASLQLPDELRSACVDLRTQAEALPLESPVPGLIAAVERFEQIR